MSGSFAIEVQQHSKHMYHCNVLLAMGSNHDQDYVQKISVMQGDTALLHAAWHGHLEAVSLLLSRGANPNLPDNTVCICVPMSDVLLILRVCSRQAVHMVTM